MSDVNISRVYLLNVPLDNEYKHTFYFVNQTEQLNYFNSKKVKSYTDFTYQRKDSTLRIPVPFDEAIKCNYVMYQNQAFNNKWFFAFITNYEFKNDDVTEIKIETDVIQTWLFDYQIKASFIEREHVDDDTIGLHTVPENLELGDFVCTKYSTDENLKELMIVIGSTLDSNGAENVTGGNYNGIYSGVKYYGGSVSYINDFIKRYDEAGKGEAITSVFLAPEFLTYDGDVYTTIQNSETVKSYEILVTEQNDTYSTKNKKLLTFPYRYLLVGNNNGASAIYNYEYFSKGINFEVQGALTPGCSIRMIPKNYKGSALNHEEGLNLGKFPICNWNSDVYTNWLTQNSVNIGLNIASGIAQVIGGVGAGVVGGPAGLVAGGSALVSGVSQITNQLTQIHQMGFVPPQSKGNTNCGDVVTASGQNTFHFYQMRIKPEYNKIIDEYFSTYGYKINRIKVPNKNHRENWWFTKTIEANIQGEVPLNDIQKIKDCYNRGITFWKNTANFKNYEVSNNII